MTAAEVLHEHIAEECGFRCICGWEVPKHVSLMCLEHHLHQLDALKAAGYALVELPKRGFIPAIWGENCTDNWPLDSAEDSVSAWTEGRIALPDGDFISIERAREFAAALLAAADAAEGQS